MRRISSRRTSSGALRAGAALLALAAVIFLFRFLAPSAFLAVTAPALTGGNSLAAAFGAFSSGFDNAKKLAAENVALTEQGTEFAQENAVLSAELADLTTLVGAVANPAPGIAAGVIARPPESAYDTLIIAGGNASGITAGEGAYAAGGVPLGTVSAASGSYARVTLLSANGMRTNAWLGPARMPIILVGQGGGAFSAEAPKSASTSEGEEVYVAGPGSLPIGTLTGQGGAASAPFITLYIKGSVNPGTITSLLIRPGPPSWSAPAATSSAGVAP